MRERATHPDLAGAARRSLAIAALLLLAGGGATAGRAETVMAAETPEMTTNNPGEPHPGGATGGNSASDAADAADASKAVADGVRLDRPTVAVPLPAAGRAQAADPLRRALAAAPTGRGRVRMSLDGMTLAAPPGVMFDVYLSTTGPRPHREYVGTLSFFGVDHRTVQRPLPARTFDVTTQLLALKGASPELPAVELVFEATDGTAGSTPAKAGTQLNPLAGLQVGSVRLHIQG